MCESHRGGSDLRCCFIPGREFWAEWISLARSKTMLTTGNGPAHSLSWRSRLEDAVLLLSSPLLLSEKLLISPVKTKCPRAFPAIGTVCFITRDFQISLSCVYCITFDVQIVTRKDHEYILMSSLENLLWWNEKRCKICTINSNKLKVITKELWIIKRKMTIQTFSFPV